jgi:regulator of sigma E protease
MAMSVIFHGLRDPKKEVEISVDRQGTTLTKKMVGTTSHSDPKVIQRLTLGLANAATTLVSKDPPVGKYIQLGYADATKIIPKLEKSDIIVGVNGEMLPISSHSEVPMEYSLNEKMHPRLSETLQLQVKRQGKTVDVEWPPVPMKSFGLRFKPGPIVAVRDDSVAATAGVVEGDELVEFNGQPIADAMTLPLIVSALHGKSASLTLEHKDKTRIQLDWQVPENFVVSSGEGFELPGTGIVYAPSNVVSGVEATSLASKSGIVAGDVIKQFKFDGSGKEDAEYMSKVFVSGYKAIIKETPLDKSHNIQYFHNLAQAFRSGMPVEISYEREGNVARTQADVHAETEWYWPERGVVFTPLQFEHKAPTMAAAIMMGVGEIRRRMGNVLEFLELLVTGRMPFKVVGGPGMIAVEATDAASKGISPLLMFLTMLSANLAIINFLPIPALDGGHMLFLTAEAVRGKPVDEALQMKLTMVGVLGLLCLMGAVIINDSMNLTRMFGG